MTRGTLGCCKCGASDHQSYGCPQPDGAEYIPEPAPSYHTEDGGDTWVLYMRASEDLGQDL